MSYSQFNDFFFYKFKGNNSSTAKDSLTKLDVCHTFKKCIFNTSFVKFRPVVTKLWLLTDIQKNGWMEGGTDERLGMAGDN